MPIQDESHARESNAIRERMRRRIANAGLLIAFAATMLTALVIFVLCACASFRL